LKTKWLAKWPECAPGRKTACAANWNVLMIISRTMNRTKTADRLAAAKAEHGRRRADQLARHEIHVHPHVGALLLVAEKAWRAQLQVQQARQPQTIDALFVPRSRRWALDPQKPK
jgi:hypothetical protein